MSISLKTVKSHLKNIYQKLSVGNRRQAVEKAKTLAILSGDG
jgi:ATP/maltotriose-dependent transcriptional regulator MalT